MTANLMEVMVLASHPGETHTPSSVGKGCARARSVPMPCPCYPSSLRVRWTWRGEPPTKNGDQKNKRIVGCWWLRRLHSYEVPTSRATRNAIPDLHKHPWVQFLLPAPGSPVFSSPPFVPQFLCQKSLFNSFQTHSSHPSYKPFPWLRCPSQPRHAATSAGNRRSHHLLQEASPGWAPRTSHACACTLLYHHQLPCLSPSTYDQPREAVGAFHTCHHVPPYLV